MSFFRIEISAISQEIYAPAERNFSVPPLNNKTAAAAVTVLENDKRVVEKPTEDDHRAIIIDKPVLATVDQFSTILLWEEEKQPSKTCSILFVLMAQDYLLWLRRVGPV